ncbi:hypothetical protein BT96DRAFT_253884 [Gymnopus androsaceus JB14]|uniref:Mid2 domain-containing protein n=1 Tax=Gymnopus androsaceus JB14 TaxID=1447944 RepID=A0A6A4ICF6_9AGAR|nr:hypothetical protein BT96DRAFT_253884 [Gymnopus androsaceus JB14]
MLSSSVPLSAQCPPNSSSQILVDDTDPRIVYSAGWIEGGNPEWECEGTTHGSNSIPGVTATFTFEGVGVQVFGTVGSTDGSPTCTYQVDSAVPLTFTFNANGMTNYRVPFYSSPALDPGTHTLVMTSIGNHTTQIYLDYIVYNPIPSSSSTLSLISTSETSSSDPTTTSPPPDSSGNAASSSVGAIAGGVVGAVGGLVLGIVLMYFFMRRRNRKSKAILDNYNGELISQFDWLHTNSRYASSL